MKLSTRSRYGVRMMYELAVGYGKDPVIIRDIAERQGISEKYLSKLIIPLKGARLVTSVRGAHGGYMLTRDPSKISLREIVEILEGDITPVECAGNNTRCDKTESCPTREIWLGLYGAITGFLEGITLDDILKAGRNGDHVSNFCI